MRWDLWLTGWTPQPRYKGWPSTDDEVRRLDLGVIIVVIPQISLALLSPCVNRTVEQTFTRSYIKYATIKSLDKKNDQLPSATPIRCTETDQQSLNDLIGYFTTAPLMAYPDYEKPFIVHKDACKDGLGAVHYQHQDGKISVIAYSSRTLR